MSEFERPLPSYRLAQTRWGDDLQAVAEREMGDANRWTELVWLNQLSHPYITTDDRMASSVVLLAGALIKIPSPAGVSDQSADGQVYGQDCVLVGKLLQDNGAGDLAVVGGTANLRQQLQHAVNTPRGQARRHAGYGCLVWRLLGTVNGPTAGRLGAEYVKATLLADYRVAGVSVAQAAISGDAVKVTARAVAIDGSVVDLG